MATMATCSNPGCTQHGSNLCSACLTSPYCGSICQIAHWVHHKEECPGHLRKVGKAHLVKAKGFDGAQNLSQMLRHADLLAAAKLIKMKDRPIEDVDKALNYRYSALLFMGRYRDALECAKEWYCMYPTNHTHPPAIEASFAVIESCLHNNEFFDDALYSRTLWETITMSRDSHIPDNKRDDFTARGASELARALWQLAVHGDMPAEEQKETGVEAIMLARRALEIHKQLRGVEHERVANDMGTLAGILDYFNDVDDDEVPCLYKQAISILTRLQGKLSANVAACLANMGATYCTIEGQEERLLPMIWTGMWLIWS